MNEYLISSLEQQLIKDPKSRVFFRLAEELRKGEAYQRAIVVCREGLAVHPGYLPARICLGRCLQSLTLFDEAVSVFQGVIEKVPDNSHALRGLGFIYFDSERWEEALAYFEMLLIHEPNDVSVREKIAEIRLKRRATRAPNRIAEAEAAPADSTDFNGMETHENLESGVEDNLETEAGFDHEVDILEKEPPEDEEPRFQQAGVPEFDKDVFDEILDNEDPLTFEEESSLAVPSAREEPPLQIHEDPPSADVPEREQALPKTIAHAVETELPTDAIDPDLEPPVPESMTHAAQTELPADAIDRDREKPAQEEHHPAELPWEEVAEKSTTISSPSGGLNETAGATQPKWIRPKRTPYKKLAYDHCLTLGLKHEKLEHYEESLEIYNLLAQKSLSDTAIHDHLERVRLLLERESKQDKKMRLLSNWLDKIKGVYYVS